MDLLSGIWVAFVSGAIVYLGLGIMWTFQYATGTAERRVFIGECMCGLGLALFTFIAIPTVMLVLHITDVITMWSVGNVLTHL